VNTSRTAGSREAVSRIASTSVSPEKRSSAIAREILTLCYYGLHDGEIRCLAKHTTDTLDNELADAA
jgi:hypothetical protein